MKVIDRTTMAIEEIRLIDPSNFDNTKKMALQYKDASTGEIIDKTIPACLQKYRKIVNEQVKEMTSAEKAAVDQAETDAAAQVEADKKDLSKTAETLTRSGLMVLLDYVNALRTNNSLSTIQDSTFISDVTDKYNSLS